MVGFAAAVAAAAATIILGAIDFGFLHPDNYPPLFVIENIPSAYGSIAFLFCVALFMFPVHSAIDKVSDFVQTFFFFYNFFVLESRDCSTEPLLQDTVSLSSSISYFLCWEWWCLASELTRSSSTVCLFQLLQKPFKSCSHWIFSSLSSSSLFHRLEVSESCLRQFPRPLHLMQTSPSEPCQQFLSLLLPRC